MKKYNEEVYDNYDLLDELTKQQLINLIIALDEGEVNLRYKTPEQAVELINQVKKGTI